MVLLNAFDPIGTAVDDALLSSSIRPISRKGWEEDDDWHLTEHLGRWLLHTLSADEEAEWERADQKRMVARHADAVQITTLQNGFQQYQLVCPPGWFANCAKQVVELLTTGSHGSAGSTDGQASCFTGRGTSAALVRFRR
ncbi:hypothetical protein EXIGLDRAFT_719496 [Exidia glandulosa HHB12029]|uniref:Uncharacterized protein n=1 Tax=Exidia glandulosa HHB12029 TaxID=1314781 RepID=A0A165NRH9_EXIGL|nr:hypothetical protein EXIGLDRAFT_719496 [Exidia glandulosa HHB12029]